jgi:hypothetical protein
VIVTLRVVTSASSPRDDGDALVVPAMPTKINAREAVRPLLYTP